MLETLIPRYRFLFYGVEANAHHLQPPTKRDVVAHPPPQNTSIYSTSQKRVAQLRVSALNALSAFNALNALTCSCATHFLSRAVN